VNKKDITDIRGTIEFLKQEGEILTIKEQVDPIDEIAAIQVALDDGPAFLFENIKGYPELRSVGNVFSRKDRIAKIFDVADYKQLKFKCVDAIRHPIPPVVVDEAPCQEVVITEDIDVTSIMPILRHTPRDGARVMGSGNVLISGKWARGGHEISFKRMHFRGKDWASMNIGPDSHCAVIVSVDHRGEDVPVTVNICPSPAVMMIAAAGNVHPVIPIGTDEPAIAGALEGFPIEICKAKTVDAYSIAKAEWVIEGFITTGKVWETEEAEKLGKDNVAPFWPEWTGYVGTAWRCRKFQVTAITHRKDPIFYNWLASSLDPHYCASDFREAFFYKLADRLVPGLVTDVHIPFALGFSGGVIYRVTKKRPRDEGYKRNRIMHTLTAQPGIRLVIAVDEDVDIYNIDDVMWAIMMRTDPRSDFLISERTGEITAGGFRGGLAIDATVPFPRKGRFERAQYTVDKIDLKRWFSEAEINAIKEQQSEYARYLAQRGG